MTGIYKIEPAKIDDFIMSYFKKGVIVILLIVLFFTIYTYYDRDFKTAMMIGLIIFSIASFAMILGYFFNKRYKSIYESFEVEILEDKLIRRGKGICEIELKYEEIGRVFMKSGFLIVLKRGFGSNMNYFFTRAINVDNMDIVIIPSILCEFEQVKDFLESKRNFCKRF